MSGLQGHVTPLKPFLQKIAGLCGNMTDRELSGFIYQYARDLPSAERACFLETLCAYTGNDSSSMEQINIFSEIHRLKKSVIQRIESIEDGTIYEERGADEAKEPSLLSENHKKALISFFMKADGFFLEGRYREATEIYKEVLSFFDYKKNSYRIHESELPIDFRDTRARYYRALYEIRDEGDFAECLLNVMWMNAPLSDYQFDLYKTPYPMLMDIFNSRQEAFSVRDQFLNNWIDRLKTVDTPRSRMLLLEALYLRDGIESVIRLVRKWKHPRGYLFWLTIEVSEKDWKRAVIIAEEALKELPLSELRSEAARILIAAGRKLGEKAIILKGKEEYFYSRPDADNLAAVVEEGIEQDQVEELMPRILKFLKEHDKFQSLQVMTLLMTGKVDSAFQIVKDFSSLGWTYNNNGEPILFAGIFSLLVIEHIERASIVKQLLERYSEYNPRLLSLLLRGLKKTVTAPVMEVRYKEIVMSVSKKRIEQIVSNNFRRSYNKAAELLGALVEYLILSGREKEGLDLVYFYRDRKFNRHPAFKKEVNIMLAKSDLIELD